MCCFFKSQHVLTWKNIKRSYKNNKFKISAPTRNEELDLHDRSYSIPNIQDYFEYINKYREKHREKAIDMFKFNTGYHHELLTPKAMKLLGSTESCKRCK